MKTKKWLSALLMLTLMASLFTISGCSLFGSDDSDGTVAEERKDASRKAREVMEAIDTIGEVTLESEAVVAEVEALYAALNDEQKAEVVNYDVLVAARSTINQMKLQGFAADYLVQAQVALVDPSAVQVNHVYVKEASEQPGLYYFTFDITVPNIAGAEEQRLYGNLTPVALSEESLGLVAKSAALSGLIGSSYWDCPVDLALDGQELDAAAIQAAYAAKL